MKPFWGINITEDKQNTSYNAQSFVSATTSPLHKKELESACRALLRSSVTKAPLSKLALIGLLWAVIIAAILLKVTGVLDKLPFVAVIICAIMLTIIILRVILTVKDRKKHKENPKRNAAKEQYDSIVRLIHSDLGVPENALDVDVMEFAYTLREGEICPDEEFCENLYCTLSVKMFLKENKLCFADTENLYSIDVTELKSIKTVKEDVIMEFWDKDIPCNEGIYAPYEMVPLADDSYVMPHYHILEFEHKGEIFGVYFHCYELPAFRKLSGLDAE